MTRRYISVQEAWLKLFWTHKYDELEPCDCVSQCVSLSFSQQMLLWLMISFLLGYLMASESCETQAWPGYRHKLKVELKCFCNCFWLPVVANVSRIQSFAESWEISRLTFKVIEVHHDTLVCVEAFLRTVATDTQHGCFIWKHLTWRFFLLDESVLILQWDCSSNALSSEPQEWDVKDWLTCANLANLKWRFNRI